MDGQIPSATLRGGQDALYYEIGLMLEVSKALRRKAAGGMGMSGKQKKGLLKKLIRFMFIDLWESTFRRKARRAIRLYHTSCPSPGEIRHTYYPRYRWLRRSKSDNMTHYVRQEWGDGRIGMIGTSAI